LELKDIEEINFDLNEIITATNEIYNEYVKERSFIVSSEISILFSRKSFVV
jgi:hypothetical protein